LNAEQAVTSDIGRGEALSHNFIYYYHVERLFTSRFRFHPPDF
jgi:hypothetical protein